MSNNMDNQGIQSSSKRDMTLINILERLADEVNAQEALLKEFIERQGNVSGIMDDSEFKQNLFRDEVDNNIRQLQDSFARYRSDMLTFVHEQDVLSKNMEDALESISKISYTLEETGTTVSGLEKEFVKHEKEVHDHILFSSQKWDNLPHEFSETNRNIAQMHADMEKYFGQVSADIELRFEKYQKETTRRLLALDDMMTALETLLIRTEPPEKKPPLPKRIIRFINRLFRRVGKGIQKAWMKLRNFCKSEQKKT